MAEPATDPFDALGSTDLRMVDSICLRFEQAWKTKPCLEDFLAQGESLSFLKPVVAKEAIFRELIRLDILYRSKRGEQPKPSDYSARFPGKEDIVDSVFTKATESEPSTSSIEESSVGDSDKTLDFQNEDNGCCGVNAGIPDKFPIPFGAYELQSYIDGAGQGIIYQAQGVLKDDFVVALKCIKSGVLATREQVERFKIEATALHRLNHPNIIPVYHVDEYEGQYYFTMKLIKGGSFKDMLPEMNGNFRAIASLISKVAHAIHYAHQRGILHRDLKPANILLDDGEPVVIDFGLATNLSGSSSEQAVICGTINYMPLEQAEGNPLLTTAVDVYSLGVVLYECLVGQRPYEATTFEDFLEQIRTFDPPKPTELNDRIPKKLEAICLKSLQRNPEMRYESAEDLARDLDSWLADEPVSVCPEHLGQRGFRWARKNPYIAALSTFLVLSLFIGTISVWYFAIQASNEATAKTQALYKAEWRQYRSQIDLVHRELLSGNYLAAKRELDTCPMTCRDWEFRYLSSLYQRTKPREILHRDEKIVWNLAINPRNANQLATVTGKGMLFIWNLLNTQKETTKVAAHNGYIWEVDWSPNGKWIATAGEDETVKIWDAKSLRLLATLNDIARSVSPAREISARLVAQAIGQLPGMNPVPATVLAIGAKDLDTSLKEAWSVKFSPDSASLLTGCEDGTVIDWRIETAKNGAFQKVIPKQVLLHRFGVWSAEYSPDGKYIVTGSGAHKRGFIIPMHGEVRIYSAATWKMNQTISDHQNACTYATFSPDGKHLISAGYDRAINVYPFSRVNGICENRRFTMTDHTDRRVVGVLASPQGNYFATGSWDKTVKLWDLETGLLIRQFLGHRGPISGLEFSPDGKVLYTASGDIDQTGVVRIWDWEIQRHAFTALNVHNEEVREVVFSCNERNYLMASASADGTIQIYNPNNKNAVKTLGEKRTGLSPVNCLTFHPVDSKYLISGHQDGATRIWNINSGELLHTFGSQKLPVLSVRISPNGKFIAAGYGKRIRLIANGADGHEGQKNGQLRIWDWHTRELVSEESDKQDSVFSLTFSPDNRKLISASGVFDPAKRQYTRGDVRAWDTASWKPKANDAMSYSHENKIECVRFSPDGQLIATAGSDQVIQLWDGNKLKHTLRGHTADVFSIAFSQDGKRLASGSLDHTLRLWDVSRGQEILQFDLPQECQSVAFSPDDRFLSAALSDGSIRLYDSEFAERSSGK